jgi:hypothetical protein
MRGAIPPLPNTPSCRGAQLKHRDNFTFTFTVTPYKAGAAVHMADFNVQCALSVFMHFVCFSEQTAIIFLNIVK